MVGLAIYLISVGLVVIGALAIIRALAIPGRARMFFASLASAVPILFGIWLFRISGLQPADFPRLAAAAAEEARRVVSTMQKSRTVGVSENAQMDPEVRKEMQRVFGK